MRRIWLLALVLMMAAGVIAWPVDSTQAQGDDPPEGEVIPGETCRYVIVRTGPDVDYPRADTLSDETAVDILEWEFANYRNAKWTRIRVPGTEIEGWVWSPYIARSTVNGVVTHEVPMRELPTRRAPEITRWSPGQVLEFITYEDIYNNGGRWYLMRAVDTGVQGWVISSGVRLESRVCNTPEFDFAGYEFPAAVWVSRPMPVFDTPDPAQQADAYLENGMSVTVTDRDGEAPDHPENVRMSYVESADGSITGWVYDRQLTYLPVAMLVRASELHVRAAPGEGADILNTLAYGACVEAVQVARADGGAWFYVQQAETGIEGWVSGDYMVLLSGRRYGYRSLSHQEVFCP